MAGWLGRADRVTLFLAATFLGATAIAVALAVVGYVQAPSRRSDLWFEVGKGGIELGVVSIIGGAIAFAFKRLEVRREPSSRWRRSVAR
jgi:hypothetical protein